MKTESRGVRVDNAGYNTDQRLVLRERHFTGGRDYHHSDFRVEKRVQRGDGFRRYCDLFSLRTLSPSQVLLRVFMVVDFENARTRASLDDETMCFTAVV